MASLKWVLLALLVVMADTADVITAIRKALVNRKDLTGIHRYLGWADKLYLDLPVSDGPEFKGYTFFAPTNGAIGGVLPLDTSDPFYDDPDFRRKVLLRHFARQRLTWDELSGSTTLIMADSSVANLSHEGETTKINDAKIRAEVLELDPPSLGNIYIIDRIFASAAEIQAVVDQNRNPAVPSPA